MTKQPGWISITRCAPSWRRFAVGLGLLLAAASLRAAEPSPTNRANIFQRRYVLIFANLSDAKHVDKVLTLMDRAAKVGYNGFVLGTTSGQYIDLWNRPPSPRYAAGFETVRQRAEALKLVLIPYAISPNEVGYAAPELTEAIPCRDTEFRVRGDHAEAVSNPAQFLQNPGFEAAQGNAPDAWGHDEPGTITFVDHEVRHGGGASVRIQDTGSGDPQNGHGRLFQEVRVAPYRAFEFSVWVKTQDLSDTGAVQFYFEGLDGGQPLVYANREHGLGAPLKATQDWTQYKVYFNSASNTRLCLFFGIWSARGQGKIWFDDADLHEVGLCHTVRRASLPVVVRAFDGVQDYEEGRDFTVEPQRLTLPASSRIADGARLKVSWYQRAEMIGPPFASASQPKYFEVEQGIARKLDTLFARPPGFMMTYDEWRIAGWDPAGGQVTAGQYMAATVRRSIDLLKAINPHYELYVWSDMFDPNENALPKYFMCNGPVTGVLEGLTPETVVVTWTGGAKALRFFADHGFRQVIGGYYSSLGNVTDWLDAVDQVEKTRAKGIDGFMYTTWDDHFADLEQVAAMIRQRGRWGAGPALGVK